MAGFRKAYVRRKRVFLAAALLLTPVKLFAAIIIDDFDAPVQLALPDLENVAVVTPGVGMLNSERSVEVSTSQTDPNGTLDVDITRDSRFALDNSDRRSVARSPAQYSLLVLHRSIRICTAG